MKFFPYGTLADLPSTPLATLRRAREIGQAAGLRFVYVGNIKAPEEQSTCCPVCGRVLIRRSGPRLLACALVDGCCPACGISIPGYRLDNLAPVAPSTVNHESDTND